MKYFPIISELFSSDTVIFLLIGLVAAFVISVIVKSNKKRKAGMIASIFIYAICEVVSNISASYFVSIITLFVGTAALGGFIGFLAAFVGSKIKKER